MKNDVQTRSAAIFIKQYKTSSGVALERRHKGTAARDVPTVTSDVGRNSKKGGPKGTEENCHSWE